MTITTSQAHSALILLSCIASKLQAGDTFHVVPEDLPWIMVALELMPQMPLAPTEDEGGGASPGGRA